MFKKNQNFIFAFDIYGISAKINTFNGYNKTKIGLIFSFIFIALSILYAFYTLFVFFKYSTPSVIYFKENEHDTERTIDMKDPFLFGLYDSNYNPLKEIDFIFSAAYAKYFKDTEEFYPVNIERCEYGKNIDTKYEDKIRDIEGLYCISNETNYPLYSTSDDEFSEIVIDIIIGEESNYTQEDLSFAVINSNNVINHMKNKPLSDIYFTVNFVDISRTKFYIINYYFQYIKYETDKGFFFKKMHTYNGKTFSDIDIKKATYNEIIDVDLVSRVTFGINNINFDYYSRSYARFQGVIIEIYWIVDIILLIGRIISSYFIDKEASIDIVKYLLVKNVIDKSISEEVSININNNNQQKESIFKEKINNNNENNYLDNKIRQSYNKSKNSDNINEIGETIYNLNTNSIFPSLEKQSNADDKIINVLNSLNYYHIIKSYFCFKDDKSKLINCCNALISDEISIEKILRRINDMEDQINFISNSLNLSIRKNDKFDEINELIDKIDKNNNQ